MATSVCLVIKGELEDVVKLGRRQARGHKCPFKVVFSFDMSSLAPLKNDRKALQALAPLGAVSQPGLPGTGVL